MCSQAESIGGDSSAVRRLKAYAGTRELSVCLSVSLFIHERATTANNTHKAPTKYSNYKEAYYVSLEMSGYGGSLRGVGENCSCPARPRFTVENDMKLQGEFSS